MKVDVLVIGGGSAGLAAAVAAARRGARTLIVERHGMLGGMGTASLVHTFCGLYFQGGDTPEVANPGFCQEIEDRMRAATGTGPVKMGRVWVLPQHPVDFARIADQMVAENGVEVWFHSELIALEPDWKAKVACRGTLIDLEADAVVDASGDAVAAALLGLPDQRAEAHRLQRPAYVFGVQGVAGDWSGLELGGRIVEGVRGGRLPQAALGMHFRASGRQGEVFGTLDLSGDERYDPTDPKSLSHLESEGRRVGSEVVAYLAQRQAGWKAALVACWPARAGVRESRRWKGKATLTGEQILGGKRCPDEVALATWPLEMRETHRGPKLRYAKDDQPAGIPAGALCPEGFERIHVAGRCISCDHEAQASIRVMGTCFASGEAAGKLAVGSK